MDKQIIIDNIIKYKKITAKNVTKIWPIIKKECVLLNCINSDEMIIDKDTNTYYDKYIIKKRKKNPNKIIYILVNDKTLYNDDEGELGEYVMTDLNELNIEFDKWKEMYCLVTNLRNEKDYKIECYEEKHLLMKCIMCKTYLSTMEWGPMLEKYIMAMFNLDRPKDKTSGDARSKNDKNIEIKISLGNEKGKFNFVQLRPDHKIDYYLFVCYNLYEDVLGKIYMFLCRSDKLYKLLPEYGSYAHGTICKKHRINAKNIKGHGSEYALRPSLNGAGKQKKLWNIMITNFLRDEQYIQQKLS